MMYYIKIECYIVQYLIVCVKYYVKTNIFRACLLRMGKQIDRLAFHLQVLIIQAKIQFQQPLHHPAVQKGPAK